MIFQNISSEYLSEIKVKFCMNLTIQKQTRCNIIQKESFMNKNTGEHSFNLGMAAVAIATVGLLFRKHLI